MRNFLVYMRNGFGFSKSFRFAFGYTPKHAFINLMTVAVASAVFLLFIYFTLESVADEAEYRAGVSRGYQNSLEKVVASCLREGIGGTVTIGEKIYFCAIVDSGERI